MPARALLVIASAIAAASFLAAAGAAPPPADVLVRNARVYTADAARPWARALAIKDGRLVAVGNDADADAHRGPRTTVVDAGGRLVVPGLIDTHFHLPMGAQQLDAIDLLDAADLAEIQRRVREHGRRQPDVPWIRGRGWFYSALPGGRPPTRADLDAVEAARPVYLEAYDGHSAWVNSRGLERAGITRATPDPANGVIVRDAAGEPTGMLKESAVELAHAAIPKPSPAEKRALLERALALLARNGLTMVQNAHGTAEELDLYAELERAGKLTARLYTALSAVPPADAMGARTFPTTEDLVHKAVELKGRYRSPLVRAGAVKIVADGVIEAQTASLLEPYANVPASRGLPNYTNEALAALVRALDAAGVQVWTHAIGDGAVRATLDAYEQAARANGPRDRRHRIEHVETHQSSDTPRFASLGVIASMQPMHAEPTDNMTVVWAGAIGPERASRAWAWGSLRRAGARLAFGSDWPVVGMSPFEGLHVAVNRQTRKGQPAGGWLPEQKLSLEEALAGYTTGGAYAAFLDQETGSLVPGKWADLVVLRDDLFTVPPDRLHENAALLTMVGGRVVFRDAALSAPREGF
jgi:predicted amidohydrolase YtcJ